MVQLADLYRIDNFIDTFALGHYARVLYAQHQRTGSAVAFKVLRPEHLAEDPRWEYRAFANEADLLMKLADSPQVVKLYDCGYVSARGEAPIDGEIESFGTNVQTFARELAAFSDRGWRPYLALENLPRNNNLFYQMRPDKQGTRLRLPSEEGLALALQFAELLKLAHSRNIVYMDHKLEHVYWDGLQLRVIDFNSSRLLEKSRDNPAQMFRSDVHNLCVGILYSIFTGLSPQKTALRPQPGTITDVEARYKDIDSLDFGVEPTLSQGLQTLLQSGAAVQIESADELIGGLREVATAHGWDFPNYASSPINREARSQLRAGISRVRRGQDYLREARDLFREAAIQDGIPDELEDELKRLVKSINDMLQNRVIP